MNKRTFLTWLTVFLSSLILDSIGHLVIANGYITKQVAEVLKPMTEINPLPIMIEYLLVSVGIVYFLKQTNASQKPLSYAATQGALIGLMIYGISGIIDVTFLVKWSWNVVIINTLIGTIVLGISAVLGRLVSFTK